MARRREARSRAERCRPGRTPRRVPPRDRTAGVGLPHATARHREARADAAPAEHRPHHLSPARRRRTGPPRRSGPSLALPAARGAGQRRRPARLYTVPAVRRPLRDVVPRTRSPAAAAAAARDAQPRSRSTSGDVRTCSTRWRSARLRIGRGRSGARAISASICSAARRVTLVASTESWEVVEALTPEARRTRSPSGAGGLLAARVRGARSTWPRELVLAADQFIITPGGPRRRSGAGARRGRRGAHRHRRLSLVHRLGPRHDDQPRGADAVDRASREAGVHPAHVRALRARRPDPNMFPEGERRRPVPHRRRDAVVLPRGRIATSRATGDRDTLRAAAAEVASTSSSITSQARGSASASIRRRTAARRGRRATSSPGWTRRSTTGW